MFLDGFDNEEDIIRQYEAPADALKDATVLFALYNTGNYEGYSFVLFRKDDKYYEVNGSHCSCNGLEGQWSPEETNIEFLENRFFNTHESYIFEDCPKAKEALRKVLFDLLIDTEYLS